MKQINCAEHIALACSAVNSSLQAVKTLFYGRELCEIHFYIKKKKISS